MLKKRRVSPSQAFGNVLKFTPKSAVVVAANATCLTVSDRDSRISSRQRARCTRVISRCFEHHADSPKNWEFWTICQLATCDNRRPRTGLDLSPYTVITLLVKRRQLVELTPNLETVPVISRQMRDGIWKRKIVNLEDPDQDNGTNLLNYCHRPWISEQNFELN
ncbi:hypothetical protein TNCV_4872061 [Trichonephila clavipes]|nr:hypothetical protein TNCV_4872061 [Trichonephila clavipes]